MPARFRIDYFELILETTCAVCGFSFVETPDIENDEYECPKCEQAYKVNFKIATVSKIEQSKKEIRRNMTPNPSFTEDDS